MSRPKGPIGRLARSRIYVNAYALVLNQIVSAGLGLVYWMLAARLYGVEVVGASSAAISTLLLISGVAQLGLREGMYRFVPRAGRHTRKLIAWAYVVTVAASVVLGIAVLWFLRASGSQSLPGVRQITPVLAILATVLWSVFAFQDGVLIGLRKSEWVLIENSIYNVLKIALLVLGALALNDAGIVASWFVPTPIVIALVTWVIFGKMLRSPLPDSGPRTNAPTLREVAFSVTGDHAGSMVAEAAVRALPLMVVAVLGAAENAYFYQAWMIAMTITLIASGMANSFSAEVAADRRSITAHSWGILRHMALVVLPAAVLVGVAAPLVLLLFGPQYAAEGTRLLRWLAFATIPAVFVVWHLAYSRVVGHIRTVFVVQSVRAVVMLGLSWLMMPRLGIESVGIAWLVVNAGAALYGLIDARATLWPTEEIDGGGASPGFILRRGDWRFLLPRPAPRRVAVFAEGVLAESARLIAREAVEGSSAEAASCDVVVARHPDAKTLVACHGALEPGGTCYAEWPAFGHRSARVVSARMEAAGFVDVRTYWPIPRASSAQIWLPLAAGARRLIGPLRQILSEHFGSSATGRLAANAFRLLLAVGPIPTVCAVASRPGAGDARSPIDFPLLGFMLEDDTQGVAPGCEFAIMRAGGGHADTKVNWLIYGGEPCELIGVAKAARDDRTAEFLRHEYEALLYLEKLGTERRGLAAPRCLHWIDDENSTLLVQSALIGTPLRTVLHTLSYDEIAKRMTAALAEMAVARTLTPHEEWFGRIVKPRLDELREHLHGPLEPSLVSSVERSLERMGDLPCILTHNDCTPWNLVLVDDKVGVFDWEEADPNGLPGMDLIYCLSTIAFAQDDVAATPRAIDTYAHLLDPDDERGAVFLQSLNEYASALGVRDEDVPRLRMLTWLWHAASEMHLLLADEDELSLEALERSVILPLLRKEVARFDADSTAQPCEVPRSAVFVAPHLDDAAMSCGAGIRRLVDSGVDVTVVTVCTDDEAPGAKISRLAMRNHRSWNLEQQPFKVRRAEDAEAMRTLGARFVHLGLKDVMYRRDADGCPVASRTVIMPPDPTDAATFERDLDESLGKIIRSSGEARIFCPAGTGGHVDHVLVRRFVETACDASRIVYYQEYPYGSRRDSASEPLDLDDAGCARVVVTPTIRELQSRIDAVTRYTSQLRGLFPTPVERIVEVLCARLPSALIPTTRPPNIEKGAERARRLISEDVSRTGGEMYWLAVPSAASPFCAPPAATPTSSRTP